MNSDAIHALGAVELPDQNLSAGHSLVIFRLGTSQFAVPVDSVERVVAVTAVVPLPEAPPGIRGVVSYHGTTVPVLDLRPRFGLDAAEIGLDARFVIVRTPARLLALLAESVEQARTVPPSVVAQVAALVPGAGMIGRVAAMPDGLIYIYDADALLSGMQEVALATALRQEAL